METRTPQRKAKRRANRRNGEKLWLSPTGIAPVHLIAIWFVVALANALLSGHGGPELFVGEHSLGPVLGWFATLVILAAFAAAEVATCRSRRHDRDRR
jgi:hypothetical protein